MVDSCSHLTEYYRFSLLPRCYYSILSLHSFFFPIQTVQHASESDVNMKTVNVFMSPFQVKIKTFRVEFLRDSFIGQATGYNDSGVSWFTSILSKYQTNTSNWITALHIYIFYTVNKKSGGIQFEFQTSLCVLLQLINKPITKF